MPVRGRQWMVLVPGLFMAGCTSLLVIVGTLLVLNLFLIKILWEWTVSDLFQGGVEEGLVAGSLSWLAAFKLALGVALMGGRARSQDGVVSGRASRAGTRTVDRPLRKSVGTLA